MEPQVLEVETVLYGLISDRKCNLKKTHLVVITFGVNFVYTALPRCKLCLCSPGAVIGTKLENQRYGKMINTVVISEL